MPAAPARAVTSAGGIAPCRRRDPVARPGLRAPRPTASTRHDDTVTARPTARRIRDVAGPADAAWADHLAKRPAVDVAGSAHRPGRGDPGLPGRADFEAR